MKHFICISDTSNENTWVVLCHTHLQAGKSWNISGILNFNSKSFVQKYLSYIKQKTYWQLTAPLFDQRTFIIFKWWTPPVLEISQISLSQPLRHTGLKKPKPVSASCSLNNSLTGLSLSYELNKKVWSCSTFKKRPFDPLYCSALNHWLYTAFSKHCFSYKGDSLHWKN